MLAGNGSASGAVDDGFDLTGGLEEALVVFRDPAEVDILAEFDLERGYHGFDVLPVGWTYLRPDQVNALADREEVLRVDSPDELEYYNDEKSRESMAVNAAHDLGYTGDGVDVAIVDGGLDANHPDFSAEGKVESNYQWIDDPFGAPDPVMWADVGANGNTDDLGHGHHCAGTMCGNGSASEGQYRGIAPDARVSSYSATKSVYVPYVVSAYDHLLKRAQSDDNDFDPVVVSNSYGVARGTTFEPLNPLNVATWKAFNQGIIPVFAAGNDGDGLGTISRYAKAPHVVGVGAGKKQNTALAGFSSRGREVGDTMDGTTVPSAAYHDRQQLLENLRSYHEAAGTEATELETGSFSGQFTPYASYSYAGVSVDEGVAETQTYELEVPADADRLNATFSVDPSNNQQVRVSIYDADDNLVARLGEEPTPVRRTLNTDVEGGQTYTVEFTPKITAVATYQFDWQLVSLGADEPLSASRPVTLFRPGVVSHGESVLSTQSPNHALGGTDTGNADQPYYARLSGTSMACPAVSGLVALIAQAAAENGHEPSSIEIIRLLEVTARDSGPRYTPATAGAGYIDAEAAVKRAAAGDFPDAAEAAEALVSEETARQGR